jgi:hypothetical protein
MMVMVMVMVMVVPRALNHNDRPVVVVVVMMVVSLSKLQFALCGRGWSALIDHFQNSCGVRDWLQ